MYSQVYSIRQTVIKNLVLACLLTSVIADNGNAAILYEFKQDTNSDALARLEFSSLPATHAEIVSLTFTQAGSDAIGISTNYIADFESTQLDGMIIRDGTGSLIGSDGFVIVTDSNPPAVTLAPFNGTSGVLESIDVVFPDGPPIPFTSGLFFNTDNVIFQFEGRFFVVPEPSSVSIFVFGLLSCLVMKKPRKRADC